MKAATVVSGSVVQGFGGIGIGLAKKCTVLLDITSTGLAPRRVIEARGLYPDPIDLINSGATKYIKGTQRVPLRDVFVSAQALLQTDRPKVARDLSLAAGRFRQ